MNDNGVLFRVLNLNEICTERCGATLLQCIQDCESDDSSCLSECIREEIECINGNLLVDISKSICDTDLKHHFSLPMWAGLSRWMHRLRKSSLWVRGKLHRFLTDFTYSFSRKRNQMASGILASMIMDQNWAVVSMRATTTKRAKINVWTTSKLVNLTALVR